MVVRFLAGACHALAVHCRQAPAARSIDLYLTDKHQPKKKNMSSGPASSQDSYQEWKFPGRQCLPSDSPQSNIKSTQILLAQLLEWKN